MFGIKGGLGPELFRKMLHVLCAMSIFLLINLFRTWHTAALALITFAFLVYPILALVERFPFYTKFFSERNKGEVKMSLIQVCLMMLVLTTVFWGLLGAGSKYIIVVGVMAWGFGDAAAALIGKAFGRHFIKHRLVEGKKTVEGTMAMFAFAGIAIFITTSLYAAAPWYHCIVIAALVAPVCAVVELFSRRGIDTITVPVSAAFSTFAVISFFSIMGI